MGCFGIQGYVITSAVDTLATSNPLNKTVEVETGAWMQNYARYPWMMLAPLTGIIFALACAWFSWQGRGGWAFVSSALSMTGIILTAGLSMFPFLMPSSTNPDVSLTMWDATSSLLTLKIMFAVACIFVPIVLGYTAYSFWVMRGRLKQSQMNQSHVLY